MTNEVISLEEARIKREHEKIKAQYPEDPQVIAQRRTRLRYKALREYREFVARLQMTQATPDGIERIMKMLDEFTHPPFDL